MDPLLLDQSNREEQGGKTSQNYNQCDHVATARYCKTVHVIQGPTTIKFPQTDRGHSNVLHQLVL